MSPDDEAVRALCECWRERQPKTLAEFGLTLQLTFDDRDQYRGTFGWRDYIASEGGEIARCRTLEETTATAERLLHEMRRLRRPLLAAVAESAA